MDLFQRRLPFRVQDELRHRLFPVVGELALDVEGDLDILALIEVPARDEPVHLGPQEHGLGDRRSDEMEPSILEFRMLRVLRGEVLVHLREVHHFTQNRFVLDSAAE